MSVNLSRILEHIDGELVESSERTDASVSAGVDTGETITLTLEADGPESTTQAISVELTHSEARLLGGRLIEPTS
ncbi:hypothetical protein Halru_0332 [Halovivax ruber XH-70]|uniref:Uncharacterized protein n=1 Tax=Halovivax ruber (strain DSM 18193 / JCM 13892 / XH-70) TaxID=797302 RepID=L0I9Q7_HALRX|nr:hypothetical protein [Halovivax ruber]AGB14976.1 hypothetical protein Halru_0332 [Halovivax ruber XH-70]